jgi:hypothetical protein
MLPGPLLGDCVGIDAQNLLKVFVKTPLYFFMVHSIGKKLLIMHAELVRCFLLVVVDMMEK